MNGEEIRSLTQALSRLFPKSDWTPEIVGLFGERIVRIEIPLRDALRVLDNHKLESRRRSPDAGTIIRKLWDAHNERAKIEKQTRKQESVPWSKRVAMTHGMPTDCGAEEILTEYHARLANRACSVADVAGHEMQPHLTSTQANELAWFGLVGDLTREGWERERAEYVADQKFGRPAARVAEKTVVIGKDKAVSFDQYDAMHPLHDLQGKKAAARAKLAGQRAGATKGSRR
jgi:hypothetical protein